jgi:hypothetical protein
MIKNKLVFGLNSTLDIVEDNWGLETITEKLVNIEIKKSPKR